MCCYMVTSEAALILYVQQEQPADGAIYVCVYS